MRVSFSVEVPDLGQRIANARQAKNLSQAQLSVLSGIALRTLQAIEQGRRGISFEGLVKICQACRIHPKRFLKGIDFFEEQLRR